MKGANGNATLSPNFVDVIPDGKLMEYGVLYISLVGALAIHKCACGCGRQAVTPLAPDEWSLIYDGESITLTPSIGNWGLPCRSHYWIVGNRILWEPDRKRRNLSAMLRHTRRQSGRYIAMIRDWLS